MGSCPPSSKKLKKVLAILYSVVVNYNSATGPGTRAQGRPRIKRRFSSNEENDYEIASSGDNANLHVSMRVTSRGHAIVHELQESGTPLDPKKYDHPVTMLYLNGDQLNLIHYCDAGNRPHMVARKSEDGKSVEFDLVDISGGTEHGHMHHGVFTLVDADQHIEDWTYMLPGDKPVHAHFDLHRAK